MIIIEKNEGTKIDYSVKGTKITFRDELTIDLAKRQKDWPVHTDICIDDENALVIGAKSGRFYVAEIDIPPIEYDTVEPEGDGEEARTELVAKPLDMAKVTLTLWALPYAE